MLASTGLSRPQLRQQQLVAMTRTHIPVIVCVCCVLCCAQASGHGFTGVGSPGGAGGGAGVTAAVGAGGGGGPDVKTKQTESTLTAQLICNNWPRGVTVSTLDSESSDRDSNPREALSFATARRTHGSPGESVSCP